jgi:hypothetical protein
MNRTLAAIALIAAAATLSACTVAPTASTPSPSPSTICRGDKCYAPALYYGAEVLSSLLTMDGYAGFHTFVETNTLQIAWVGEPPQAAIDVLSAHGDEFTVTFVDAKYTLHQMKAAAKKLSKYLGDDKLVSGITLNTAMADENGRFLWIGYSGDPADAAAVEAAASEIAGMDTFAEVGGALVGQ